MQFMLPNVASLMIHEESVRKEMFHKSFLKTKYIGHDETRQRQRQRERMLWIWMWMDAVKHITQRNKMWQFCFT